MTAPSTPLLALDAVIFDTETTGLDAARARIVQIGAVTLKQGGILADTAFETKVDPGEPIPAAAAAIHGLDAAALSGAPRFPAAFAAFERYRAGGALIGHNIGFDLAVLARECRLAGLAAPKGPTLCTRLLAELCFPRLAGWSLDKLAAHLELDIADRHDALADARLAGRLFLALLPHLKARGIRTLGEAEAACRSLTESLDGHRRAGWIEPIRPPNEPETVLSRIDAYPFQHRVRDVMSAPPLSVPPTLSLGDAARLMTEKRVSSLFVADDPNASIETIGILTERDVMRALVASAAAALERRVGEIASRPLLVVPAEAFVYRALGRMDRHRVRHLGVVDEAGRLVGALSARDLLRLRASDALMLGDAIDAAEDVPALALAWARMPQTARRLVAEGVPGREIAAVISREIGALTRRAAILAERRLAQDGHGPPPVPYAVLVLGSAGRGESLLAPDQDNAILFADTLDEAAADAWFARLGAAMTAMLDEAGIPLCKGAVMATNPAWRGSLSRFRARVEDWAGRNRPEDLLAADIFFDFRPVHGDHALGATLFADAYAAAHRAPVLSKLLAAELETWAPPLGWLGGLRGEGGRLDLKKFGLFPVVAAARCLALRHGLPERATPARLNAARATGLGADADLARMDEAHALVIDTLLRRQLADIAAGRQPGNTVELGALSRAEARKLTEALGALKHVGTTVRDLLFANRDHA